MSQHGDMHRRAWQAFCRGHTRRTSHGDPRTSRWISGLQHVTYKDAQHAAGMTSTENDFNITTDMFPLKVQNLSATCHSSVFSQWTQSCNGHGSGSAHAMAGKDGTCYNINTTRSSKLSIQQTNPPPQPSPEEANIISHHPTRYRMCDGGQTPASSINTKYMEHTEHGETS